MQEVIFTFTDAPIGITAAYREEARLQWNAFVAATEYLAQRHGVDLQYSNSVTELHEVDLTPTMDR